MANMQAMVNSGQRKRYNVWANRRQKRYGEICIHRADKIDAMKMPVPVALNQFKRSSAGSGLPSPPMTETSGCTCWCKLGTVQRVSPMLFKIPCTCGSPQANTQAERMIQGIHALATSRRVKP